MLFLNESEIRGAITLPEAIQSMEEAFAAYSRKEAIVPPVMHLDVPKRAGEVHVKSAHVLSAPDYVIKIAAGFYDNKKDGLPIGSGMMLVFSAQTGFPEAILMDNAYLTDLRTAAAGAVAAKYLALPEVEQVAVIGAGGQGRFQIEALACVRNFKRVMVFDHHTTNIVRYLESMQGSLASEFRSASNVEEAVRGSQIVITTTPSQEPYLRGAWVGPGTHITAMGSDGSHKQELHTDVLQARRSDYRGQSFAMYSNRRNPSCCKRWLVARRRCGWRTGRCCARTYSRQNRSGRNHALRFNRRWRARCLYCLTRFEKGKRARLGKVNLTLKFLAKAQKILEKIFTLYESTIYQRGSRR